MPISNHPLLARQIHRARGADGALDLERLLASVEAAYVEHDAARARNERATLLMSEEMQALNATVRRDADASFAAVIDQLGDGAIVADEDLGVSRMNAAALDMFGGADASTFTSLRQLLPGVSLTAERDLAIDAQRACGEVFPALVTLTPIALDGRRLWLAIVRDMTAQRRREEQLEDARRAAEAANHSKSLFLAMMSHELRTPMNGVLGISQVLARTPLNAEQQDYLKILTQAGDSLLTILNDILDLSKVEAGKLELIEEVLDTNALIEPVAKMWASRAAEKDIGFDVWIAPGAPRRVRGDAVRIRQVLNNLLSNAVKFTETGAVKLEIDTRIGLHGEDLLVARVVDSGIGISPGALARLFGAFEQVDLTHTRRFHGTGLGLAISRRLARLMGGDITVTSQENVGSTFEVTLALPVEEPGALASEPTQAFAPTSTMGHALRVLAVDDNETNRMVLRLFLSALLIEADFATDGEGALERLASQTYDAVLMDLHMPGVDGLEATRRLRASSGPNANAPVIAVTADLIGDVEARCLAAGMTDFITKPIDPRALHSALERAATQRRSRAA